MSTNASDYPWCMYRPDGQLDPGRVPDRLLRHPEIQRRGIDLRTSLKPGVVFATRVDQPAWVVKVLDPNGEELAIYERLLPERKRPNNHTIPAQVNYEDHPMLIMPMLFDSYVIHLEERSPRTLIDMIFQFVEGVEYLHSLHIVHMDLCPDNVLAAAHWHMDHHKEAVLNRLYIIDFDLARQFTLGPGMQRAIALPETQYHPPKGLTHFDPYSWDVHLSGRALEWLVESKYRWADESPHPLAQSFIQWLIGDERGCTGVCRCRPTARNSLKVVLVLRWTFWSAAPEDHVWMVDALSGLWTDSIQQSEAVSDEAS